MDKPVFFWNGFEPVLRILVIGTLGYIALVLILKWSGKRTLASMNAFDFIITVTIGSVFGRILTAKAVSISEGITAFVLLAVLQFIFSYLEIRSDLFKKLITAKPAILYYKGEFMHKTMRKERLDKNALLGAARKKGYATFDEISLIILESDASFSIIGKTEAGEESTYQKLMEDQSG